MKPLAFDDLLDLDRYEAVRRELREAVIAHKHDRRVAVGDRVSVVFEDRETLRWQVLEMARVERLRSPELLQQELSVYNQLLPGSGELSATLFLEITDADEIRPELDRLIGIDEHVALVLGNGTDAESVPARFDEKQMDDERISAVQYIRFRLSADQQQRFLDPTVPARLRIDHPSYVAETTLGDRVRRSLAQDLRGGGPALIDFEAARSSAAEQERVLEEHGRVRAVEPATPPAPGQVHIRVEPREDVAGFVDADPELLAELAALAQRVARQLGQRDGGCPVQIELEERPLRYWIRSRPPKPSS